MRYFLPRLILIMVILVLAGSVFAQEEEPSRSFAFFKPSRYDEDDSPLPLVIMLHGSGGNSATSIQTTRLHEIAERDGFFVLYPDGLDFVWNDDPGTAYDTGVDDIGFILGVIDSTSQQVNIDQSRIFVTGFSNGGGMAYLLACEAPERFAAIAAVGASLSMANADDCLSGDNPTSVLVMHGTADRFILTSRGMRDPETLETVTLAPSDAVRFWAEYNGCGTYHRNRTLPDADPEDGTRVRRTLYEHCENGAQVAYYEIEGGGHTWPGQNFNFAPGRVVSYDINASEVIWQFFADVSDYNLGD